METDPTKPSQPIKMQEPTTPEACIACFKRQQMTQPKVEPTCILIYICLLQ
jgi:hypothetical protein